MSFSKYKILSLFLVVCLFACNSNSKQQFKFADNQIVAHRGAWKQNNFPHNSIAALKHAIALNCVGSEFDIKMTGDDVLIVIHDGDYNGLQVEHSTYAELSKFKLANGEMLPTLKDFIKTALTNNKGTGLVCEIKPSKIKGRNPIIAEKVVNLVKELKAEDHVLAYISFSYEVLEKIIEIDPKAKTQYLDGSKSPEKLKEDGVSGLDYLTYKLKNKPDWIKNAKEKGLTINTWTANTVEDIDWALANNFDFITTDEPELVFDKIKTRSTSKNYELEE